MKAMQAFTDPGSLIRNTQCGNFRIFLLLRFYVKSISVILKPLNCHFDHLSCCEFCILGNFWHFHVWNVSKNQESKLQKLLKRQFLTFWNHPKLISRKIRVAEKLLNFHNVEYPQPKVPIRMPRSVLFYQSSRPQCGSIIIFLSLRFYVKSNLF